MELKNIVEWFEKAKPNPTMKDLCVQVGCHLEEVVEMLNAFGYDSLDASTASARAETALTELANMFKGGGISSITFDPVAVLDATRDQCVTGVGIDYMMGANSVLAQREVNRSNNSKFEDGKPVFHESGKIAKGKHYTPPSLAPFTDGYFKLNLQDDL